MDLEIEVDASGVCNMVIKRNIPSVPDSRIHSQANSIILEWHTHEGFEYLEEAWWSGLLLLNLPAVYHVFVW
jgi:hypothetical protein